MPHGAEVLRLTKIEAPSTRRGSVESLGNGAGVKARHDNAIPGAVCCSPCNHRAPMRLHCDHHRVPALNNFSAKLGISNDQHHLRSLFGQQSLQCAPTADKHHPIQQPLTDRRLIGYLAGGSNELQRLIDNGRLNDNRAAAASYASAQLFGSVRATGQCNGTVEQTTGAALPILPPARCERELLRVQPEPLSQPQLGAGRFSQPRHDVVQPKCPHLAPVTVAGAQRGPFTSLAPRP